MDERIGFMLYQSCVNRRNVGRCVGVCVTAVYVESG